MTVQGQMEKAVRNGGYEYYFLSSITITIIVEHVVTTPLLLLISVSDMA